MQSKPFLRAVTALTTGLISTQALAADRRMKVLEIGTGSGYQTAVLSRLCRRVYSIERYRELVVEALESLDEEEELDAT